jgi:hypothetical protein
MNASPEAWLLMSFPDFERRSNAAERAIEANRVTQSPDDSNPVIVLARLNCYV